MNDSHRGLHGLCPRRYKRRGFFSHTIAADEFAFSDMDFGFHYRLTTNGADHISGGGLIRGKGNFGFTQGKYLLQGSGQQPLGGFISAHALGTGLQK